MKRCICASSILARSIRKFRLLAMAATWNVVWVLAAWLVLATPWAALTGRERAMLARGSVPGRDSGAKRTTLTMVEVQRRAHHQVRVYG